MTVKYVKMSSLFTPFQINTMQVGNRFIRSATMDNLGNQGMVSDAQLKLYGELSRGEIGLIITGGLFPTRNGQAARGQLGAHTDDVIPSLEKLVNVVHKNNGKIAAQILHGGFQCRPEVSGLPPVGPSAMFNKGTGQQIKELSGDEIRELVESFVQAARRIREAGFDAVQLHGAHGWLLSAFLSPVMNRRGDEWGGSPEKGASFLRQICEGIRKMAGPDYPILIKLGLQDYHPEGKTLTEGIQVARILETSGIDAIEVSEGIEEGWGHHIRRDAVQPYYIRECREARKSLRLPLILVGGMRYIRDMQAILDDNIADAVSMCRPFLRDPHIVRKLHEGLVDGSDCNSCNGCLPKMQKGNIHCILP